MCCCCGDFNARMGCLNDFVHDTPCNNVTNDNCLTEKFARCDSEFVWTVVG